MFNNALPVQQPVQQQQQQPPPLLGQHQGSFPVMYDYPAFHYYPVPVLQDTTTTTNNNSHRNSIGYGNFNHIYNEIRDFYRNEVINVVQVAAAKYKKNRIMRIRKLRRKLGRKFWGEIRQQYKDFVSEKSVRQLQGQLNRQLEALVQPPMAKKTGLTTTAAATTTTTTTTTSIVPIMVVVEKVSTDLTHQPPTHDSPNNNNDCQSIQPVIPDGNNNKKDEDKHNASIPVALPDHVYHELREAYRNEVIDVLHVLPNNSERIKLRCQFWKKRRKQLHDEGIVTTEKSFKVLCQRVYSYYYRRKLLPLIQQPLAATTTTAATTTNTTTTTTSTDMHVPIVDSMTQQQQDMQMKEVKNHDVDDNNSNYNNNNNNNSNNTNSNGDDDDDDISTMPKYIVYHVQRMIENGP